MIEKYSDVSICRAIRNGYFDSKQGNKSLTFVLIDGKQQLTGVTLLTPDKDY